MCYLPPEHSFRYYDVNKFYDTLLSLIYQYKNEGILYICGDFNSRCGDNDDFIRGIDDVIERDVIDFNMNRYGDLLIEFLINVNMCMLNGRNNTYNAFTSISSKDKSVVDYCIVSHVKLS